MDAHQRYHLTASGPVVAFNGRTMIVNDRAAELGLDRAELWERVREAGPTPREISVTEHFGAVPYPVTPGQPDHGFVLVLRRHPSAPPHHGDIDDHLATNLGPLERAEKQVIIEILDECADNRSEAAQRLGISRGTPYQRLRRYRLD